MDVVAGKARMAKTTAESGFNNDPVALFQFVPLGCQLSDFLDPSDDLMP
jgi:hypothetical protein